MGRWEAYSVAPVKTSLPVFRRWCGWEPGHLSEIFSSPKPHLTKHVSSHSKQYSAPHVPCSLFPQVVVAGSQDTFQIFAWSLKTGRLLDVLAAHEGPVVALQFAPNAPLLASASWDK